MKTYNFKEQYELALAKRENRFEAVVAGIREHNPELADRSKNELRGDLHKKLAILRTTFISSLDSVLVSTRKASLSEIEKATGNLLDSYRKAINEVLKLDMSTWDFAGLLTKSFLESEKEYHYRFGAELAKIPFSSEITEIRRVYPVISLFFKNNRYKVYRDHLYKVLVIFSEKIINGML